MKSLQRNFAVCTIGHQGAVVLTPRDLHLHSCDAGLREFLEQSVIKLEECAKHTKTKAIVAVKEHKHVISFSNVKRFFNFVTKHIKSRSNTLLSISTILVFFSLMIG
ncbi:MAG: hypothetical protein QM504_05420 [Pseudomonadota bacterium]